MFPKSASSWFRMFLNFNAEAQRTLRTAEKGIQIDFAHLRVLCASALIFFYSITSARISAMIAAASSDNATVSLLPLDKSLI